MRFVWNICLFFGVKHEPPSWENVGKYSHPSHEHLGMRAATKKTTHDPGPLLKGAHQEKENSSEVVICEVSQVLFVELRRKTPQFLSPQNHTERKHPSCVSSYFQAKWPEIGAGEFSMLNLARVWFKIPENWGKWIHFWRICFKWVKENHHLVSFVGKSIQIQKNMEINSPKTAHVFCDMTCVGRFWLGGGSFQKDGGHFGITCMGFWKPRGGSIRRGFCLGIETPCTWDFFKFLDDDIVGDIFLEM